MTSQSSDQFWKVGPERFQKIQDKKNPRTKQNKKRTQCLQSSSIINYYNDFIYIMKCRENTTTCTTWNNFLYVWPQRYNFEFVKKTKNKKKKKKPTQDIHCVRHTVPFKKKKGKKLKPPSGSVHLLTYFHRQQPVCAPTVHNSGTDTTSDITHTHHGQCQVTDPARWSANILSDAGHYAHHGPHPAGACRTGKNWSVTRKKKWKAAIFV